MNRQIIGLIVVAIAIVLIVRYLRQNLNTTEHYARLVAAVGRASRSASERQAMNNLVNQSRNSQKKIITMMMVVVVLAEIH